MVALVASGAIASPADDPVVETFRILARQADADLFWGDGEWGAMALARKARPYLENETAPGSTWAGEADFLKSALAGELSVLGRPTSWPPHMTWRPGIHTGAGDIPLVNNGGDTEDGLLSLRASMAFSALTGPWELDLHPVMAADLENGTPVASGRMSGAWIGLRSDHVLVGFGRQDRWMGPGRRGTLVLSDEARAPPMGNLAFDWRFPGWGQRLGRFRFETSAGWADRPRSDVDHPGLLLMDARWLPLSEIEVGVTRLELFGGEGRPMPGLGQLLLPTHPHVYDDPNRVKADQDDIASVDVRGMAPLGRWFGGPFGWVEGWWQYGAEDIIAKKWADVPYPSLAGIADLWGLEANMGRFVGTIERARIFDDYYRWYVEHRVYREGFTQDGLVMGHEIGGDALSWWFRLAWMPLPWGVDVWYEPVRRIGVIDDVGSAILALAADERHQRAGVDLWHLDGKGSSWSGGCAVDVVRGADFVPGASRLLWSIELRWNGGDLGASTTRTSARTNAFQPPVPSPGT
jgi:hypothetical protein